MFEIVLNGLAKVAFALQKNTTGKKKMVLLCRVHYCLILPPSQSHTAAVFTLIHEEVGDLICSPVDPQFIPLRHHKSFSNVLILS